MYKITITRTNSSDSIKDELSKEFPDDVTWTRLLTGFTKLLKVFFSYLNTDDVLGWAEKGVQDDEF